MASTFLQQSSRWWVAPFLWVMLAPIAASEGMPITFGTGMPCLTVPAGEQLSIYTHQLSSGSSTGHLNHLWSVGGGGPTSPELSGRQVYHFYIDGEAEVSVQFEMRQASGIVFDPVISRTCLHTQEARTPPNGSTQHRPQCRGALSGSAKAAT